MVPHTSRGESVLATQGGTVTVTASEAELFNPVSFSRTKEPGAFRVFCVGGSVTYGWPYDFNGAYPIWIEDLLKASFPDRTIEIINLGALSYGSVRVSSLVNEALIFSPDAVIAYVGHEEFLENEAAPSAASTDRDPAAVLSQLEGLNRDQILGLLIERSRSIEPSNASHCTGSSEHSSYFPLSVSGPESSLHGKRFLPPDEAARMRAYFGRPEGCTRSEECRREVIAGLVHNVRSMSRACREAAVPLMLIDPVSNLADFSPARSVFSPGTGYDERQQIEELLQIVPTLIEYDRYGETLSILEDLLRLDSNYAESLYWKGRALMGLARTREARDSLMRARDLDAWSLRAVTEIEQECKRAAQDEGIIGIPFRNVVHTWASTTGDRSGVPGAESFLDHVHPVFELHQALAELIVDKMAEHGLLEEARSITDEQRVRLSQKARSRLDPYRMATGDYRLACGRKWNGKEGVYGLLENAVEVLDDNPSVHWLLGNSLMEEGRAHDAIGALSTAVELSKAPAASVDLATAHRDAGRNKEALEILQSLLEQEHGVRSAPAHESLARILLEEGDLETAKRVLEAGMRGNPTSVNLLAPYAKALAAAGTYSEAIPWMLRAAHMEPDNPSHWVELAAYYNRVGKSGQALELLQWAMKKGYREPNSLRSDPDFESLHNDEGFQRILDSDG